jgi:hypothetical protein
MDWGALYVARSTAVIAASHKPAVVGETVADSPPFEARLHAFCVK